MPPPASNMLLDKIQEDLKNSQLQKDEARTSVLRMLISAIRYTGNGRDAEFSDENVTSVIQKEIKKRVEAATAFKAGNRQELAAKEDAEAEILKTYLPTQMSDEELGSIVDSAISETGASELKDMGKVIGEVMGKVKGQADGGRVSGMVKQKLQG